MHKLKYILTWVSLFLAIAGGILMLIVAWNGRLENEDFSRVMILLLAGIVSGSVYLFCFAVIQTQKNYRESMIPTSENVDQVPRQTGGREPAGLNPEAAVRKVIRGLPGIDQKNVLGEFLLQNLAKELEIMSGIVYFNNKGGEFTPEAYYAVPPSEKASSFQEGEGINGQVAKNGQVTIFPNIPENYLEVRSGLGSSRHAYLAMIPITKGKRTFLLIECAGFKYELKDLERTFQLLSRGLSEMIEKSSNSFT